MIELYLDMQESEKKLEEDKQNFVLNFLLIKKKLIIIITINKMTLTNNRPLIFDNQEIDNCKVGINKKTAPQSTLDVNGDTKINGTLDVNGNATLSGTLGLGENNDFGTAGAILTSNGSGSAVSWSYPYYIRAYKTNTQHSTDETIIIINSLAIDSDVTSSNATDNLISGTTWKPPPGIYMFNLQADMSGAVNNIFEIQLFLYKNSNEIRKVIVINENNSSGQNISNYTLNMNDLISSNGNDNFDFRVKVDIVGDNSGLEYNVKAGSFFSAYRIG